MHDWQLIQDYVERGSESAFRELVERHLHLVHSAALRQVQNAQLAEEISQAVFILLARKARDFRSSIVLPGWLFRTTRFIAQRALRTEQRRQRREQEAYAMQPLTTPENAAPVLAPLLDEALARLQAKDRDAVLLRFMQDQSLRQVGDHLGLSEEAAKKRVSRAVDKLRGFFAGRGFTVSAGVLSSVLGMQSIQAAPDGLAVRVAARALVHGTGGSTALPALVQETLDAWRWSKRMWAGSLASVAVATVITVLLVMWPSAPFEPSAEGHFLEAVAPDPVAAGPVEPAVIGQQRLRPGEKTLDLLVLASDNSDAVANATVVLQTVLEGRWEHRQDLATDASGRIEVPYPNGAGRLDVGVFSPGFAARYATWMAGREDPIPTGYILRLDRVTNSVGGWLRDEQDRPISGAEVVAAFGDRGESSGRETPRERRGLPVETVLARSGPDGWWTTATFPQEAHGGFTLSGTHPDFADTVIASDDSRRSPTDPKPERLQQLWAGTLVTRLERAATLTGQVSDESDRPIAGALVLHNPFSYDKLAVETDSEGHFTIPKLPREMFGFSVSAAGFAPEYRELELTGPVHSVQVRLQPGATLRLHAVDESGAGVSGLTIVLEQWGQHRHKLDWSATTDNDGRIEWNSAPRDVELELCAHGAGYCYSRQIRVKAGEQEHVVRVRRALELVGNVTDAESGQLITQCKAFPGYGEGDFVWERGSTRRGQDGMYTVRFEEDRLPWRFRVEAEGYEPFISDPVAPNLEGPLHVVLKRLDRDLYIRGVVWRPDNQPAAGAEIALLTLEHNVTLSRGQFRQERENPLILTADAQGGFVFAPNPLAHSIVAVSPEGFARIRLINPREPVGIRLQPWSRLEGLIAPEVLARRVDRVMLRDPAAPNYGGHITLDPRHFHVDPEADGRFCFEFVPPLPLSLSLDSGVGVSYYHRTPVLPAPGETARVMIADRGIRVKGRFTSPPEGLTNWVAQTASANLWARQSVPVPPPELTGHAAKFWLVDLWQSEAGQQLALGSANTDLRVAADGTFESKGCLPPGDYQLHASIGDARLNLVITLPSPDPEAMAVLDMGELPLSDHRPINSN